MKSMKALSVLIVILGCTFPAAAQFAPFNASQLSPAYESEIVLSQRSPVHERDILAAPRSPAYESDILAARPIRYWFGIAPGGNYFDHQGSFSPSCNCEFRDRDGGGFTLAGEFRMEYPKLGFAWGVLVGHVDASAEFSRQSRRTSVIVGDEPDIEVDYRNTSMVKLQWLRIDPGVYWYIPRSRFFLRGGVEIGIPIEYRYDHREFILTEGVEYYKGGTENVLLEEQDIPGGDRLRFALTVGLGYDIVLTPSLALTPRLGAAVPLTTVSSTDKDWTVLTAHGLLMLNLRL
jgi:hypothetical protein